LYLGKGLLLSSLLPHPLIPARLKPPATSASQRKKCLRSDDGLEVCIGHLSSMARGQLGQDLATYPVRDEPNPAVGEQEM
jgi:hypothetical protein